MNVKMIGAVISFGILITGVFAGNLIQAMMIGEINRTRKDGKLVSYFGFTPAKNFQIVREYRNSYPNGKLYIYHCGAIASMVVGFLGVAAYIIGP
jgi:hypothetical protein